MEYSERLISQIAQYTKNMGFSSEYPKQPFRGLQDFLFYRHYFFEKMSEKDHVAMIQRLTSENLSKRNDIPFVIMNFPRKNENYIRIGDFRPAKSTKSPYRMSRKKNI